MTVTSPRSSDDPNACRACGDCGATHETGLDGLVCDWHIGGPERVRDVLARTGVAPDVAERTMREVSEAATR